MKKFFKTVFWFLTILLIVIGGIAYYLNEQIGDIGSLEDRKAKFSDLEYYSSQTGEFISPEKLVSHPEQTTGGDPGLSLIHI